MVFGAYLYKKSFSVVKDQQSSCWLTSHGDLSGLLARWTLHHEEYDITPSHKSGRKHRGDDCLSRAPVEPSLTVSDDDGDAFLRAVHDTIIRERHYSDPEIQAVLDHLENQACDVPQVFSQSLPDLYVRDGVLYRKNFTGTEEKPGSR